MMFRNLPTRASFVVVFALFGAAASVSVGSPRAGAEEVVVTSETAAVKVKDDVIGHVQSGDRFEVLERRGGWVAISFKTDGGTKRGWVLANHLQSQTDEAEAAPDAPTVVAPGVDVNVDSIQFSLQGNEGYLFARMTIENTGGSELSYDESAIRLLIDDDEAGPVDQGKRRYSSHRVYTGFASETAMRVRYSRDLKNLGKGTLPPGQLVEGWLEFPVTQLRRGANLDNRFVLEGRIGDSEFKIDLREQSLANLDPRIRASKFDPSVKVAEVFGGLNALNLPALRNLLELDADSDNSQGVVLPKTDAFFLDQQLLDQLRSTTYSRSSSATPSPIVIVRPEKQSPQSNGYSHSTYLSNLPVFKSETEAVIHALAARSNAVDLLTPLLDHSDATVRVAACLGLAGRLDDGEAVRALVAAAKDPDPKVRAASVQSLGGYGYARTSYRRVNRAAAATPDVVETLVSALKDDVAAVRTNAARAASRVSDPKVIESLVGLLEDPESGVVTVACSSLGTLKAKSAVGSLQKLRQSDDAQRRTVAIRALGAIGELSPVETSLAQLNEGTPAYGDFDILLKEKDQRAVEPLIQFLKGKNANSSYVDKAARALGALGDQRATDVLVAHLRYGNRYSGEIPTALGELGDVAAIGPLREALTAESSTSRRAAIYGALTRLNDKGILDELKQMLKKPDPAKLDTPAILKAIGLSRDDEATSLIAPYLDDQRYHRYAIEALIEQGTDKAYDALTKRLLAADYAFGSTILSQLRSKQSSETIALIRTAADSDNANTRRSAEAYIRSIDGGASDRAKQHQALIGKAYTPLTAEHWINGTELGPEDLKNKVVLLDFWAVWCGPCVATFPHLRDWHEQYGDQGLEIIGVTRYYKYDWDEDAKRPVRDNSLSPSDENKALEAFLKHHDLKHRIAVLASDSKTTAAYRVSGIPQAVLIDRGGKIRLIKVGSGEANAQAIEEMIQRSLKELDLSGQSITDAELESYLQDADEITSLNLQGSEITDAGLTALAGLKQLESLRLDGTAVSDKGLELLARQGNLGGLKVLGLSDTKVTAEGLKSLAQLSGLEELAVATRGLDDQSLGTIGKLVSLRSLSLGDGWGAASITDEGLRQLSGMTQLQQLEMHGTSISDEGLQTLQPLSSLESIGLVETKVTPQDVAELGKSLPELNVRIDQWSPWLTRSEYQRHFAGMVRKKFFPLQVEGRVGDEQPLYRGRFVPYPTDREFVFKSMHATPHAEYVRKRGEAQRDGMNQVSLFSFRGAETDEMFNGTWVVGRLEAYWKTPMIVAKRSLQQALQARRDGDLDAAAKSYRAVLDAQPESVRANILLAHTLRAMEQHDAATEAYERTVDVIDGIPEKQRAVSEWGYLGQALYRLDRWFESRAAFDRVIEMRGEKEPVLGSGPRWWYLTMLLHRLGEEEQAIETFQTLAKQLSDGATKEQISFRDEAAKLLGISETNNQP